MLISGGDIIVHRAGALNLDQAAFGSQQLLGQQKGLWHLIAARHHKMTAL